jgi:putative DNA primase/helicase
MYESNCLLHMSQNGIPFQGPLICDGALHRFSRDGKGNPDEWYLAYSGLLNSGQLYTYCIYGSWSDGSKFEYK